MDIKKEVELETIELLAYEELCKNVGISPRIEITPGRDYDENGELASWYEDKYYPDFTKSKQRKLLNYILKSEKAPALIAHMTKLLLEAGKISHKEVKEIIESGRATYE